VATVGTLATVGIVGSEAEEAEPEPSRDREPSLEASETEFDERKMTFEYLKQYRKLYRMTRSCRNSQPSVP